MSLDDVLSMGAGFGVGVFAACALILALIGDVQSTCDDYRTRAIDQCRAEHGTDVGAYLDCVGELPRCE